MIDRVEVFRFSNPPGIAITFHYDTACEDTFAVFEHGQVSQLMEMMAAEVEPERVLIAIRHFGNFQLH